MKTIATITMLLALCMCAWACEETRVEPPPCGDVEFDPYNCGRCGNVCPEGFGCCNGCFRLDRNEEHCGECYNRCTLDEVCLAGACEPKGGTP
jgi:hypothetical protein